MSFPAGVRRKKPDDDQQDDGELDLSESQDVMKFTLLSRKGNKQQVRVRRRSHALADILQAKQIPIPSSSSLAVHVRSAQAQDKEEQQHLKKLVLDYEHREEIEEMKGDLSLP